MEPAMDERERNGIEIFNAALERSVGAERNAYPQGSSAAQVTEYLPVLVV